MPSAELIDVLEAALDNPAYDMPDKSTWKPARGRPRFLPEDHITVKTRMGNELAAILDRKRGHKSRSEYIRELIAQA